MAERQELRPLPVGIQTFRKIIEGGFLYVDKTRWIYDLIRHPYGVYFMARPRRFGKSLLVSTLDEIFRGNRELFRGLWLYDSPYRWEPYPVIRIDFSRQAVNSAAALERSIQRILQRLARYHGVTLREGNPLEQFEDLILELATQGLVVILIDEYDKPILDNIENLAEARRIRDVLKGFYSVIKSLDEYIQFVFLTGISKFSRVGVFSGLNNLQDISMHDRYAAMLGITQEELETRFADHITVLARRQGLTTAEALAQIRTWYDGFCFSADCTHVYNPFSLLLLFETQAFRPYWFESGTPTFLLKLIKSRGYDVPQLERLNLDELAFSTYELDKLEIVPLLFQTGYLTIKSYNRQTRRYRLSYPNYEVEYAFLTYLLGEFGGVEKAFATSYLSRLVQALQGGDWERFFEVLNTFLANIPYDIQIRRERYYQTVFYLIFKLIGLEIDAEVRTSRGRIDAVIELPDRVHLFEFKLEGTAQEALSQIKEREYFVRYREAGKTLTLVGVSFDPQQRSIDDWCIEEGAAG